MKILVLDERETISKSVLTDADGMDVVYQGKYFFYKKPSFFKQFNCVIYRNYYDELNQLSALKAMVSDVPVAFLTDGVFDWQNSLRDSRNKLYSPLFATHVFSVGTLEQCYISTLNLHSLTYSKYLPANAAVGKSIMNSNEKRYDFLLTTASNPYFDEKELIDLVSLLQGVVSSANKLGYKMAYRIFDQYLASRLDLSDQNNLIVGSFDEIASRCNAVVTTPSTIAITAMSIGLPVAILRYRDGPLAQSSGWNIFPGVDIGKTLSSMLALDKERMLYQQTQLQASGQNVESLSSVCQQVLLMAPDGDRPTLEIEKYVDARYYKPHFFLYKMIMSWVFAWKKF